MVFRIFLMSIQIFFLVVLILIFYEPLKLYINTKQYQKERFKVYLLGLWGIFLFICMVLSYFLKYNSYYLIGGTCIFLSLFVFTILVRKIKDKSYLLTEQERKGTTSIANKYYISEYQFFLYISGFACILISFIFAFSLFYFHAVPLEQNWLSGYMSKDGVDKTLGFGDSIVYSGNTFFSMDSGTINPKGFLRFISLFQLLLSQIIIISFIGILASELLRILKLKEVG